MDWGAADNGRIPIGRGIIRNGYPPAGVSYELNTISRRWDPQWAEYPAGWIFTDNGDKPNGRTALRNGYLPLMVGYPLGGVSYVMDIQR